VDTPWPEAVLVASTEALHAKVGAVKNFIDFARGACEDFLSAYEDDAMKYLAAWHGLSMEEALDFMGGTCWTCESRVSLDTILRPLERLKRLGFVDDSRRYDPMRFLGRQFSLDPVRGVSIWSETCPDDEDLFATLPDELAPTVSFPADLLPMVIEDKISSSTKPSPAPWALQARVTSRLCSKALTVGDALRLGQPEGDAGLLRSCSREFSNPPVMARRLNEDACRQLEQEADSPMPAG